jgi:hypothetical protein
MSLLDYGSLLLLSFDEPWYKEDGSRESYQIIYDGTFTRGPPSRHRGPSILLTVIETFAKESSRAIEFWERRRKKRGLMRKPLV